MPPEKRDIDPKKGTANPKKGRVGITQKPPQTRQIRLCGQSSRARAKKQEKTRKKPAKKPAVETRPVGNSRRCWRAKARGTPAGFPHRCAAAPLPAYRGPQQGPQCAPLRPTACAASPCVSPLRPPSGGDESPSVVRGVGHTGLRPFFPSPLPGAWVVPGQSRAAALSGGGPCPRCAAGRASHPLHP